MASAPLPVTFVTRYSPRKSVWKSTYWYTTGSLNIPLVPLLFTYLRKFASIVSLSSIAFHCSVNSVADLLYTKNRTNITYVIIQAIKSCIVQLAMLVSTQRRISRGIYWYTLAKNRSCAIFAVNLSIKSPTCTLIDENYTRVATTRKNVLSSVRKYNLRLWKTHWAICKWPFSLADVLYAD